MSSYALTWGKTTIDEIPRTIFTLLLIPIMVFTLSAWNCGAAQTWLNLATQDLPVLAQQAANIVSLVDPADAAVAKIISDAAVSAVSLVSDAVNAYNANPTNTTLQNVVNAINKAAVDLPNVLAAANITNGVTLAVITAAVDLIVTTLDIIAANIPVAGKHAKARLVKKGITSTKIPTPAQLRKEWNEQVCAKAVHCKQM